MKQRTLPMAVSHSGCDSGINVSNGLSARGLAGSRTRLRERVTNLQGKWHKADTGLFVSRSGGAA